jgi:hypothetical protein
LGVQKKLPLRFFAFCYVGIEVFRLVFRNRQ